MTVDGVHPKAEEAYMQLPCYNFSGFYKRVERNRDYRTLRAVFEIDSQDPTNEKLLTLFSTIRHWNSYNVAKASQNLVFFYAVVSKIHVLYGLMSNL